MITNTQKQTAQAIVRLFETSTVRGDYGQVTVIPGDTGHLSYGLFQATLGSGNLHLLVRDYCASPGARFASTLNAYVARLEQRDVALDNDGHLKNLLRACADDAVMRDTQDAFFETGYWVPASRMADKLGIATPLGLAVVFDGFVQGSFGLIQKNVSAGIGTPAQVGEQRWLQEYVAQRRAWLAGSKRTDLRATVYRMDAFGRLMEQGYWAFPLPLVVRDHEISEQTLAALPPNCYTGPPPGSRTLFLETPLMRGLDVRLAQLALSERGYPVLADGIFGQTSQRFVSQFQETAGLARTGAIEAALFSKLGVLGG